MVLYLKKKNTNAWFLSLHTEGWTPGIMTSKVPGDFDRQQSLGTTDFKVKGYWLQRPNYSHKEKWLQK